MANKHVKWCSASLAIKLIKIETGMRYSFTLLRESTPRQVDKKSGVPKDEKGVWDFFFFFLKPGIDDYTQTSQFKFCTKDYITTIYP